MTTSGTVTLKEIREMLDACAPGARIVAKEHRNWVLYDRKTFRGLPLGKHGRSRENAEVEIGHVRRMARFFAILECARKHLPQL